MAFDYKAWAKENRAHLRAYHAEWRKKNKHRIRTYSQAENAKASRRAYSEKPEVRIEARKRASKWAKDNPERINKRNAQWKRAHPEAVSKQGAEYRARDIGAPGHHTTKQTKELLAAQDFLCANPYCRADLRVVKKHLDHKTPLSRGGSNWIENLQWLCKPCNLSKWAKDNETWLTQQGERT